MSNQQIITGNLHQSGLLTDVATRSVNERPPRTPGAVVVLLSAMPAEALGVAGPYGFDPATATATAPPAAAIRKQKLVNNGLDCCQADRDLLLAQLAAAAGLTLGDDLAAQVAKINAALA